MSVHTAWVAADGTHPACVTCVTLQRHSLPLCETTVCGLPPGSAGPTAEMPTAHTSGPAAGGVVVQPSPSGQTRSHGAPVVPGATAPEGDEMCGAGVGRG